MWPWASHFLSPVFASLEWGDSISLGAKAQGLAEPIPVEAEGKDDPGAVFAQFVRSTVLVVTHARPGPVQQGHLGTVAPSSPPQRPARRHSQSYLSSQRGRAWEALPILPAGEGAVGVRYSQNWQLGSSWWREAWGGDPGDQGSGQGALGFSPSCPVGGSR